MRPGTYILIGYAIALTVAAWVAGEREDALAQGLSIGLLAISLWRLLARFVAWIRKLRAGKRTATAHGTARIAPRTAGNAARHTRSSASLTREVETPGKSRRLGIAIALIGAVGGLVALHSARSDGDVRDWAYVAVALVMTLTGLYQAVSGRSFNHVIARWDALGPSATDALGVSIVGIALAAFAVAIWRIMGS